MYEKKRVFILVKTYPHISAKYAELVCTAGIQEDGSWIRLYPVQFRMLQNDQMYKKYTWITLNAERNTKDLRYESYRPETESICLERELAPVNGHVDWATRNKIIFRNQKIYTNLDELIHEAHTTKKSLAVFKPTKIVDFTIQPEKTEWDPEILEALKSQAAQMNLFGELLETAAAQLRKAICSCADCVLFPTANSHRAAVILLKGSVVDQGGLDGGVSSIPHCAAP